jgi:hypothetical protein
MRKETIQRHVLKSISKLTSKLYRDNDWSGVWNLVDAIASLGYKVEVGTKDGGYRKNSDGQQWKEYRVLVSLGEIQTEGTLYCNAAGSMQDPFGCYDMSLCF